MMDTKKLQVKITSKDKTYYQGEAFAVSSKNEIGVFDILAKHANFVTTIMGYVDVHKDSQNKIRFEMDRGILKVRENIVEIFMGI